MVPVAIPRSIKILFALLLPAYVLGIQLMGIQRPFLGHYASYQGTVMASIARNMVRENFSEIFLPKTDSIIAGRRSLHLNQYPLPSLLAARAIKWTGQSYEFWGRLQAIAFNFFSILLVFAIVRRLFDERTAWVGVTIFSLSPITVVYGQSFMSEASSLFFFLSSFYLLIGPAGCGWFQTALSGLSFSMAITGRLHWILFMPFFCAPLWWAGGRQRWGKLLLFGVLAMALPALWYAHTYFASLRAPHVHTNLFLQMATSQKGSAFWFRPELYKALGITFGKNMFALVVFPFLFLGIPEAWKSRGGKLCVFAGGGISVLMFVLSPEKLIRHDFYLYAVFPFLAPVAALGVMAVIDRFRKITLPLFAVFLTLLLAASAAFSFRPLFSVPESEEKMLWVAGKVREVAFPGEPIVIGGENTGIIAYYADRPSWTLTPSAVGQRLNPYLRMLRYTGRNQDAVDQLEKASRNPTELLEYFHAQGAAYFVVSEADDFKKFPGFLSFISAHYRDISDDPREYHLYCLKCPVNVS